MLRRRPLERELEVALPNFDITIDLSEAEELGAEGIEALARASNKVRGWNLGRLFLLAEPRSLDPFQMVRSGSPTWS